MTYALDVWYEPPELKEGGKRRTGSVRALKELGKIQRLASIAITGSLHSTPMDILDAHAGLLPIQLLLEKICYQNLLQVCTLPSTNPVMRIARRCVTSPDRKHLTNLQVLTRRYKLDPRCIETIHPPSYTSADVLPIQKKIANTRKESMESEREDQNQIKVYSDGSGQNGRIGAAAILIIDGKSTPEMTLKYHLGSAEEHTTYEAEIVGAILAMKLVKEKMGEQRGETGDVQAIMHYTDSQSIIKAIHATKKSKLGQYLVNSYRRETHKIAQIQESEIELRWISAHSGVDGNELVDKEAKAAAAGESSDSRDLPAVLKKGLKISKSALKQKMAAKTKDDWEKEWKKSPRNEWMTRIDPDHPYKKFRERRDMFNRNQGSILVQLRSGHLPINTYLKRIGKRDNDMCDWCKQELGREVPETVNHFILDCSAYENERDIMSRKIGKSNTQELKRILATEDGLEELLNYLDSTKRFRSTMGRLDVREYQREDIQRRRKKHQ